MKLKYQVFVIIAYMEELENGTLTDSCELQLIENSIEEALERAKSLVKKNNYKLNMIVEKYEE